MQQIVGLFIYPVSAAGGFMLGIVLGSGKPIEMMMSRPGGYVTLLILICILEPLSYLLTRRMCQSYLGQHLDNMQNNIREIEEEK